MYSRGRTFKTIHMAWRKVAQLGATFGTAPPPRPRGVESIAREKRCAARDRSHQRCEIEAEMMYMTGLYIPLMYSNISNE